MKAKVEELAAGVREFDVEIYRGEIVARATEGENWQLEWSSDRDDEAAVERDGDVVRIRQRSQPANPPRLDLRLSIPAGTEVIGLQTGHGRVTGDRLRGQVTLQSGNGDLILRAGSGAARLSTANGRIEALDVEGNLHAHTGNGDILLQDAAGDAQLDTGAGRIEVVAPRGITLAAHSGHGDVHVGDGAVQRLHLQTNAGKVSCSADLAPGQHHLSSGHGDIELRVARGEVELETASGRIAVRDAKGSLRAHSGNGEILLEAASGDAELDTNAGRIKVLVPRELRVRARSGHGDIHIGDGSVQTLHLETNRGNVQCSAGLAAATHAIHNGNGDVNLRAARGEIQLRTSSGRIEVIDTDGHLHAHTGNGDILLQTATGDVELKTNRGRIEVSAPEAVAVRAESGSGDIQIGEGSVRALQLKTNAGKVNCSADPLAGQHELVSGNGDLAFRLRVDARAHVDAQTSFGQIHTDFPLVRVGRSGSMSFNGMRMVGSIGAGEPDVHIALRTTRGQIELRRREVAPGERQPVPATRRSRKDEQPDDAPASDRTLDVLRALAQGEISLEEADALLQGEAAPR